MISSGTGGGNPFTNKYNRIRNSIIKPTSDVEKLQQSCKATSKSPQVVGHIVPPGSGNLSTSIPIPK
ncbi:hypothetical protein Y1Q_0021765 [Alligator mississippiensis]|uniref:Uncharacterized protein n=1 Tax=Alligator mississippiensis TaxID=8496 RepID=A0A151PB16_ALLMI|nr:hypothetical protein Y1Q_0021765 [Alligator mississippiensis]